MDTYEAVLDRVQSRMINDGYEETYDQSLYLDDDDNKSDALELIRLNTGLFDELAEASDFEGLLLNALKCPKNPIAALKLVGAIHEYMNGRIDSVLESAAEDIPGEDWAWKKMAEDEQYYIDSNS